MGQEDGAIALTENRPKTGGAPSASTVKKQATVCLVTAKKQRKPGARLVANNQKNNQSRFPILNSIKGNQPPDESACKMLAASTA